MKNMDARDMIKPNTEAVAIETFILSVIKCRYGTDNVPPPIPIRELIIPFVKKYELPALLINFIFLLIISESLNNINANMIKIML